MRRRLTPRRVGLCLTLLTAALAIGCCCYVAGHLIALHDPPGGRLISVHDGCRIYEVPGNDVATLRRLKEWAAKWGYRTTTQTGGYGGKLATITLQDSGTTVVNGVKYAVRKDHYQVCVRDAELTPANLWLRTRLIFSGRM